ncbi:YdbL family protein [Pseudoalteromonas xiamenensis]|uniref:YdbL family protein n=1 Tax=Pseudoalteromonas xiamenensis TaxID=882626 RepID=A0A975DHN9_9GAMM|nr:YdbL family protein [Pseudoalteromonas xiamenensis]QTH71317.1 YdbL family protein [Pseudoalteromonas xiamenensis]
MNLLRVIKTSAMTMIALAFSASVFAMSLQDAKDQGLVGELRNGYLGVAVSSQEVESLVKDINQKRKIAYADIAERNNLTLDQVAARAGIKNLERTQVGLLVENAQGQLVKK